MKRKLRNYFFTGLLVVIPVFGSIGLLGWVFVKITNFFLPNHEMTTATIVFWRFVGLLLLLSSIIFIGLLAQSLLMKKLFSIGERILIRIPLLSKVYVALKQISNAIWGKQKTILRGVVLVEYPRRGMYSIGFATSESQGEVQEKTQEKVINVFIPTTPNPTSGVLVMVPEKDVKYLDMKIEEGLKLVISGGAVVPEWKNTHTKSSLESTLIHHEQNDELPAAPAPVS